MMVPRCKNQVRRLSVCKRGRQGSGTREVREELGPEPSVSRPVPANLRKLKGFGKLTEACLDLVTSRPVRRRFHRSKCVGPDARIETCLPTRAWNEAGIVFPSVSIPPVPIRLPCGGMGTHKPERKPYDSSASAESLPPNGETVRRPPGERLQQP